MFVIYTDYITNKEFVNRGNKIMKWTPIALTERTERIKECYLKSPVALETDPYKDRKYHCFASGDRWISLGYLRGWLKYKNASTTRLRASYAEAEELLQSKPIINDDELLVGQLYFPEYTEEEWAEYRKLCEMHEMSSRNFARKLPRKDHIALDYDKLLKVGVNGLIEEIEKKQSELDLEAPDAYPDYEPYRRWEFYECCLIELRAVLDLEARYARTARDMAKTAMEPRRSELLRIAQIMEKVPANPAESFYEAIQSVQFFLGCLFGLYAMARPDRYLYEYYKRDIENGKLTNELAQELIDNFCLHISTRIFSRSACGFIVGGQDENGELVENELTYMFLTALDHIRMPDPNGAIAVNDKTSNDILKYCADILSRGVTHPAFYNDNAIINSLVKYYGVERKDAVRYIHSTCAEISTAGTSKAHSTPFSPDMPRLLCECVKKNLDAGSFEALFDAYVTELKANAKTELHKYILGMMEASRVGNEQMRINALIDDCITRGRSTYEGGEKYMFIQPNMIGFATALDSLVAIRELVFTEKRFTLAEFDKIVENNYEGEEALRSYIIKKLPHYGNDDERVDTLAAELAGRIKNIFRETDIPFGKYMVPGTFSYIQHAKKGETMGATYDARLAGISYSDGCCSVQGRDVSGETAMVKSLTSWDQSEFLGGMVVNVKFGAGSLKGESADRFVALLRTFVERGGIEMQVNVVDRETLLAAREHPEEYASLTVRVGGYSDYFIRLTPALQAEVIERTQY